MGPINPERSVAATTALTYCLPPPHTLRPLPATPSESTGQEAKQGSPSRLLFIEEYHFATAKLVPNGLPKRCLLRLETIPPSSQQPRRRNRLLLPSLVLSFLGSDRFMSFLGSDRFRIFST